MGLRQPSSTLTTWLRAAVWREFFDARRIHAVTRERRADGSPALIEGDYVCLYDPEGGSPGISGFSAASVSARASGTNDKAGSILNLVRRVSPRSIKENFNPPTDYRYPFMSEE